MITMPKIISNKPFALFNIANNDIIPKVALV